MDNFGFKPERKKLNRKSVIWNLLTIMVLLGTCCQAAYFLTVYNRPNSFLNLFPPPQPLPTLFQTVTPTSTVILLEATWTPSLTVSPVPSRTVAPTWTIFPGNTPKSTITITVTPSATPTLTATPTITPNRAGTATAACLSFHSKFPRTPCP